MKEAILRIRNLFIMMIIFLLAGCTCYAPISTVTRYYEVTLSCVFVQQPPTGSQFIGTIKMVPRDSSFPSRNEYARLKGTLLKEAAKLGAHYAIITYFTPTSKDMSSYIGNSYGDGATLEANLYR